MSSFRPRYALHDSIGYHMTLAARTFERRLEEGLRAAGLSRADWCVLLAIEEEGRRTPSAIARFLEVDRTAVSRTLRKLEASGMVTRTRGGGDGRTRRLSVTDKGRAALDAAIPAATRTQAHFNAKLTEEERAALIALLTRIRAGEPDSPSHI